jgi:hypothetical protein
MAELNTDQIDCKNKKPVYNCDKCNYITYKLDHYNKHCKTISHLTGRKSHKKHTCEHCDFETINTMNMKIHKLNNHSTK